MPRTIFTCCIFNGICVVCLILSICAVNNQINYVFTIITYYFCIGIKLFGNILCNFFIIIIIFTILMNYFLILWNILVTSNFQLTTTYIIEIHILIFSSLIMILFTICIFKHIHIVLFVTNIYIYIKENFKIFLPYTSTYLESKKCKIYNQHSPRISTR